MLIAWQYGLLPPLREGPYAWAADCEREMELQSSLWNRLVEIEKERRAGERVALVAGNPELGARWDEFEATIAELDDLPRRDPRNLELRTRRHTQWVELKPLLAAARREHQADLKVLADRRYAAVVEARQTSKLWWGNYNAVTAAFDVALGRLAPGDQLHEQHWNGEGRLTNQIMKGVLAASLRQGGHSQLHIEDMPAGHRLLRKGAGANRRARREDGWVRQLKLLVATVYSSGGGASRRLAAWPIVLHRDFPPGALVKQVAIHRRRIVSLDPPPGQRGNPWDWRWTATFSCEVADVAPSRSLLACGIDIGWRKIEDGGTRVATIAAAGGPNGVVVEHVVLEQDWLDRRADLAELFGAARVLADAMSTQYWARLQHRAWRRMRQRYAHGLDQINTERREYYRHIAKRVSLSFGRIIVDATNTARLSRRKRLGDIGVDAAPEARRQRSWVAPAQLIAEIERAARARGCEVQLAQGKSTVRCNLCAFENTYSSEERLQLMLQCKGCGAVWDQDENAARNLFDAADDQAEAAALKLARRENKGLKKARMTRKKKPAAEQPEAPPP